MNPSPRYSRISLLFACGLAFAACSSSDSASDQPVSTESPTTIVQTTTTLAADSAACETPPLNPFFADSPAPIGHIDASQSNGSPTAGPRDSTQTLTPADLQYVHLGPGHAGLAISSKYPDGSRVIWSNGADRISKIDAKTFELLAELPRPDKELLSSDEADANIALMDQQSGSELALTGLGFGAKYLLGLTGIYYALDVDNTLFIGGEDSVLAYQDQTVGDPRSPIILRDEWKRPAEITGGFVGVNMTFDGKLVVVTDEGWIVVLDRDFSDYVAIALPGQEAAATHNAEVVASGVTLASASWVRNSIAVDDQGGIYAVSLNEMHKVVWDGTKLSTSPADGAWSAPYSNSAGKGSGATPALMGYCDDRFVVITDGDEQMNVVLFWRAGVPQGWEQIEGALSPQIAGQELVTMGDPKLTAIQSEQGVVVGGYGALVVNNDSPTIPDGYPAKAARLLVSYSGADPAFAPHGMQKFAWDPVKRVFESAWINQQASSANAVPLVSLGSNTLYTVGGRDGKWALEGLDWTTGESVLTWITGSVRYNTLFAGVFIDDEGHIVHGTTFGMVRYPAR